MHGGALELLVLELFYRSAEIGGRLKLNKPSNQIRYAYFYKNDDQPDCGIGSALPLSVTLASNFRVDNVESRTTGKVFEILQ